MNAKKLYKEMYSAARLWLNAEEINLDKIQPSVIPGHTDYPFICWQEWLGKYSTILYSMWVYPDGRINFMRLDCHTHKETGLSLREEAA